MSAAISSEEVASAAGSLHYPGPVNAEPASKSTAESRTSSVAAPNRERIHLWILVAALIGFFLKLVIAYNTFGTNDSLTFYSFARSLSEHGLEWTYRHGVIWVRSGSLFNHPPVTAYFLQAIHYLSHQESFRASGLNFPFLLRFPGIVADFIVVLILLRIAGPDVSRKSWALILFALSPVSLMVSGFHGNTDSVMVMFLVLACYAAMREQSWLCGLFLALSCQVKIVPVLLFPVFVCFWLHRRRLVPFLVPFVVASVALLWQPLFNFPALYIKNVVSYGSYWGIWGISYWLRLTGLRDFSWVWYEGFSPLQNIVVDILKGVIVLSVIVMGWRRRALEGIEIFRSVAIGWTIFFIFSPGVCAQYMVWLAPFILFLSPGFYAWVTATSALFLFFFYNTIAHGLPWYFAVSTNELSSVWTPWTIWPWSALIIGSVLIWRRAKQADPGLRLLSIATLSAAP